MSRPIERHAKAMKRQDLQLPLLPLTNEEEGYYAAVMSGLASHLHGSEVVRSLAAGIAQAMSEIRKAGEIIEAEGLVVKSPQGSKPNPAAQIRDAATKRLAALASRPGVPHHHEAGGGCP